VNVLMCSCVVWDADFYLPLAEEKIDDSSSVDAFLRCMIAAMSRPASDADEFVDRLAENWIVNVSQLYLIDDAGWNQLRFPLLLKQAVLTVMSTRPWDASLATTYQDASEARRVTLEFDQSSSPDKQTHKRKARKG
jgi:hypothetical protein